MAQQHDSGEVLMLAWMNAEAVAETLAAGRVCYFSRSPGAVVAEGRELGPASGGLPANSWTTEPAIMLAIAVEASHDPAANDLTFLLVRDIVPGRFSPTHAYGAGQSQTRPVPRQAMRRSQVQEPMTDPPVPC